MLTHRETGSGGGRRVAPRPAHRNVRCMPQDALRAEWEEKEKLRPLSQERTIQSVAAAEGDAVGG